MIIVSDLLEALFRLAPLSYSYEGDPSGLLVGDFSAPVGRVSVALDPRMETLREAVEKGCNTLLTHHPFPYHDVSTFVRGEPESERLMYAKMHGLQLIALHTCLDRAPGGVNDVLCNRLGLSDVKAYPCRDDLPGEMPLLRVGALSEPMSPEQFGEYVKKALGISAVRMSRGCRPVSRVCVCGGAGGSFVRDAALTGADAYVSGEFAHFDFIDASEWGITLIDATHFATEKPVCEMLIAYIKKNFPGLEVLSSGADKDTATLL